ncbi:MAG: CDP-alcohol phosphatidyltransferase family protein [Tannerella sp.]|nr:CDP-alcohol phosphatidyltransferase family protein [Tannerella sp.]
MDKEFEASLKSVETENVVDLYFYRPIGFQISRILQNTGITPNMITALSIFVGVGAGVMFAFDSLVFNLTGIFLLIFANILDCVDGQLARMTGIKSEIGRILDGAAGYLWFLAIYVCLALRLTNMYHTAWFFLPALISGLSQILQANITDYYKTVHLFFVSREKGLEFNNLEQVRRKQRTVDSGFQKFFFALYEGYTGLQENVTPALQRLLKDIRTKYGDDVPENIRVEFRQKSRELMKYCIDFLTFNGRTVILFAVVLTGHIWVYFMYETVILNLVLFIGIRRYEKMCVKISELLRRQAA